MKRKEVLLHFWILAEACATGRANRYPRWVRAAIAAAAANLPPSPTELPEPPGPFLEISVAEIAVREKARKSKSDKAAARLESVRMQIEEIAERDFPSESQRVEAALRSPDLAILSKRQIASALRVSPALVSQVGKQLQ